MSALVAVAALAVTVFALVPGPAGARSLDAPPASRSSRAGGASLSAQRAVDTALADAAVPTTSTSAALAPVAAPTRLVVPEIGVDSPLVHLGTQSDGTLQVPTSWTTAGWFADGPAPGAVGGAVIAGHVDSTQGPGVFAELARLTPGDRVTVDRADGTSVTFVVTRTEQVAKTSFPTDQVYGPAVAPELRLITCGGAFSRATGHYLDNVLVFATEV